ncbi:MAG: hypothetical protein ACBR15_19770 [Microcoleus sp.]
MVNTSAIIEQQSDRVPLKTWIGVMGTILGAFMAVLDIQITNASLKDIQAALSVVRSHIRKIGDRTFLLGQLAKAIAVSGKLLLYFLRSLF